MSVLENIHSQRVHLDKYIYKLFWILETSGFTERPLAHDTLLCLAAEYTFSCACVAMKQKENKSWVCIGKSWVCMSP